jgi:quercetin dioxygenase-like cupin family protein
VVKPYNQKYTNPYTIHRTFKHDTDSEELCWHRDREEREVRVLQGSNWKLQLDNQLPVVLEHGNLYVIPKNRHHRIIKGDKDLVVEITLK